MSEIARALVSTFGSAGDLFPLIPAVQELRARGVDIRVAAQRGVGLYLRANGIPTVALGDGSELQVVEDPRIFSRRFDGWESWHRTVNAYVLPSLASDARRLDAVLDDWTPDVVVASGFAAAARAVARGRGIPLLDVSIYPQHDALAHGGRAFTAAFRRACEAAAGPLRGTPPGPGWAWGAPADVVLHDRALLGPGQPDLPIVGFPAWDGVPGRPEDEAAMERFLSGPGPKVIVTLGSFIGVVQQGAWRAAADAVEALGVRAAFVGARGRWADLEFAGRADIACVGFVPLSRFLPEADVVVHHGGIGTTFGAVRAGVPSLVLAQAFDQPFNGRLVEGAGVGRPTSEETLADDLAAVLAAPPDVAAVARRLVPSAQATNRLVDAVVAAPQEQP